MLLVIGDFIEVLHQTTQQSKVRLWEAPDQLADCVQASLVRFDLCKKSGELESAISSLVTHVRPLSVLRTKR